MNKTLPLENYYDVLEYLHAFLLEKKQVNPGFSLKVWAQHLGLKSSGYLSNVLRGKRKITPSLLDKLLGYFSFSEVENEYFVLLVNYSQAQDLATKQTYTQLLKTFNRNFDFQSFDLDKFHFINEWYYLAILEMVKLKDFKNCEKFICDKLNHKVETGTVKIVLERLKRMGLISEKNGNLVLNRDKPVFLSDKKSNEAIQNHHSQYMDLAKDALDLDVDHRVFYGTNMAIKKKNLSKLKELVHNFHKELNKLSEDGEADYVYRINSQAFPVTTIE